MSENKYPIGGYAPGEIKYGQLWARHSELVIREDLGKYRIDFEGLKKAVEEVMALQPKPAGSVWVKGDYDRLYDQLKADVNCRIVCYVDYNTRSKNPDGIPYILRDICSIWGENMEFGSRGIGYGSVRFMPGDYKENFIELCKQMNVEWLHESSTAAVQYESVFVPCAEDDPNVSGGYTSNDGRSLCYVKEVLATIKK